MRKTQSQRHFSAIRSPTSQAEMYMPNVEVTHNHYYGYIPRMNENCNQSRKPGAIRRKKAEYYSHKPQHFDEDHKAQRRAQKKTRQDDWYESYRREVAFNLQKEAKNEAERRAYKLKIQKEAERDAFRRELTFKLQAEAKQQAQRRAHKLNLQQQAYHQTLRRKMKLKMQKEFQYEAQRREMRSKIQEEEADHNALRREFKLRLQEDAVESFKVFLRCHYRNEDPEVYRRQLELRLEDESKEGAYRKAIQSLLEEISLEDYEAYRKAHHHRLIAESESEDSSQAHDDLMRLPQPYL